MFTTNSQRAMFQEPAEAYVASAVERGIAVLNSNPEGHNQYTGGGGEKRAGGSKLTDRQTATRSSNKETAKANNASAAAKKSSTAEDHAEARDAHFQAADEHRNAAEEARKSGEHSMAAKHEAAADVHDKIGMTHDKKESAINAPKSSQKALAASKKATSAGGDEFDHEQASHAHIKAKIQQESAGNHKLAAVHDKAANQHRAEMSKKGYIGMGMYKSKDD